MADIFEIVRYDHFKVLAQPGYDKDGIIFGVVPVNHNDLFHARDYYTERDWGKDALEHAKARAKELNEDEIERKNDRQAQIERIRMIQAQEKERA